jgi:hypothetical protein
MEQASNVKLARDHGRSNNGNSDANCGTNVAEDFVGVLGRVVRRDNVESGRQSGGQKQHQQ